MGGGGEALICTAMEAWKGCSAASYTVNYSRGGILYSSCPRAIMVTQIANKARTLEYPCRLSGPVRSMTYSKAPLTCVNGQSFSLENIRRWGEMRGGGFLAKQAKNACSGMYAKSLTTKIVNKWQINAVWLQYTIEQSNILLYF
jgi:hypothetical protein